MMREYCECNKSRRLRTNSVDSRISTDIAGSQTSDQFLNATEDRTTRSNSVSGPPTIHSPTNPMPTPGRRLSYAAIAASLSPSNSTEIPHHKNDLMDIDDDCDSNHKAESISESISFSGGNAWSRRPSITSTNSNNALNGDHLFAPTEEENITTSTEAAHSLKLVMQYGQMLQKEYQHDTRGKTRSSLVVTKMTELIRETVLINLIYKGNILLAGLR